MPTINPISGSGGTQPPQKATTQPPWEKKILSSYMEVIAMLESVLEGTYIPALRNANLLSQAAKTIYQFLSQEPKTYMHNIDKVLTEFLNGWDFLQKYVAKLEKEHKPVPVFLQKIMKSPEFKNLASTVEKMAKIEKNDPHYKNNPEWKKLEHDVIGKDGLLAKVYALGTKDKVLVGQAQVFATATEAEQSTIYATAKAELKKWDSIIKMTSSFMKRVMSVSQFITSTTLS